MKGYREHGFEPEYWQPQGPPMRPYNRVQWAGVACAAVGLVYMLAYFAQRVHLIEPGFKDVVPGAMLCLIGSTLINTRRQEIPEAERPGYREKQRRRTYIALGIALVAAVIGAAVAIYSNSHGA